MDFSALIDEAVKLLGAGVLAGLMWLIRAGLKKLHLELSAEQMAALERLARQGILLAEEKAAAMAKAGLKLSSEDKELVAVNYVMANGGVMSWQAKELVLANLPVAGAGAAVGSHAPKPRAR